MSSPGIIIHPLATWWILQVKFIVGLTTHVRGGSITLEVLNYFEKGESIWKVKVPKRVAFFMWTAAHGQILTLDNLMLRAYPLANRCCMCYCNAESVDHLLLFCPIAHSLWTYMLWLFGINWVMLDSVVDLFFCWYHWLGKHSSNIWNLVPSCLMWTIWTEWNRRSFQLLDLYQRTVYDWSRCWGLSDCSTLMDFLLSIRIA